MSNTFNVSVSRLKNGASSLSIGVMKNGVQVLAKQVPLNASTGTLVLADHETQSSLARMSNIYPTIWNVMTEVPDQIIWDDIHGCYQMFKDCKELTRVDISELDVTKTYLADTPETSFAEMFMNCESLVSVDLSNVKMGLATKRGAIWSTEKMFYNCSSLVSIDLTGVFEADETRLYCVPLRTSMFENCINLETITGIIDMKYASEFRDMFKNCPKLKNLQLKNCSDRLGNFEQVTGLSYDQYTIVS